MQLTPDLRVIGCRLAWSSPARSPRLHRHPPASRLNATRNPGSANAPPGCCRAPGNSPIFEASLAIEAEDSATEDNLAQDRHHRLGAVTAAARRSAIPVTILIAAWRPQPPAKPTSASIVQSCSAITKGHGRIGG